MSLPAAYVGLFPILAEKAREHGYALALHGSFNRDFDIVAIPWTDKAIPAAELIKQLHDSITFLKIDVMLDDRTENNPMFRGRIDGPEQKPHGRIAWNIHLGGGKALDISVMPRIATQEQRMAKREVQRFRDAEIYRHYIYCKMSYVEVGVKFQLSEGRVKEIVQAQFTLRRKRDSAKGIHYVIQHPHGERLENGRTGYVVAGPNYTTHALREAKALPMPEAQYLADQMNEKLTPTTG